MTIMQGAGFLLLGLAAGLVHFHLLRWNTRLFISSGALLGLGIQLLRLAVTSAVLVFAVLQHGALALLLTALGLLLARQVALRTVRTLS